VELVMPLAREEVVPSIALAILLTAINNTAINTQGWD
jgi:hypothetical protein